MERPHMDVLQLLLPTFSGTKDDYGKDVVPPLPLAFDRVNEGRPPKSKARLFQLPFEILGAITQHVHASSLADLALVNTDCRQLARSRQFASVRFDYSFESMCLLQMLLKERSERSRNNGLTLQPSLGACIRRLQIATNAQTLSEHHNVQLETLNEIDEDARAQRLKDAYESFFCAYLPVMQSVLTHALPHLELLDWEDRISIASSLFNAFACSSIQHLKLFRVSIEKEFEIELPVALAHRGWPLRTLHLELHWRIPSDNAGRTSPLCASILRNCAPTLQSLTWDTAVSSASDADVQCLDIEGRQPPNFTNLRDLELGRWMVTDSSTLDLLLCAKPQSRLKVLDVDTEVTAIRAEFFQSCGAIPSLETFVWSTFHLPADHNLSFLSSNPQLLKLSIPYAHPRELLDQRILPLLSQSFRQLKSLNLTWEGDYIAETALEQIGTLRSLQQLSLSAGEQFNWRHNWLINHRTMRRHLGNLEHLRKIAFRRDSYKVSSGDAESYYQFQYRVPILFDAEEEDAGDWEDPAELSLGQRLQICWEEQHRKRILLEADQYVRLLPKLEWLYFGQIPMGVTESAGTEAGRKAVPLSQERDDCWTLLRRMFGRENAAD